jgi:hypothetical protein
MKKRTEPARTVCEIEPADSESDSDDHAEHLVIKQGADDEQFRNAVMKLCLYTNKDGYISRAEADNALDDALYDIDEDTLDRLAEFTKMKSTRRGVRMGALIKRVRELGFRVATPTFNLHNPGMRCSENGYIARRLVQKYENTADTITDEIRASGYVNDEFGLDEGRMMGYTLFSARCPKICSNAESSEIIAKLNDKSGLPCTVYVENTGKSSEMYIPIGDKPTAVSDVITSSSAIDSDKMYTKAEITLTFMSEYLNLNPDTHHFDKALKWLNTDSLRIDFSHGVDDNTRFEVKALLNNGVSLLNSANCRYSLTFEIPEMNVVTALGVRATIKLIVNVHTSLFIHPEKGSRIDVSLTDYINTSSVHGKREPIRVKRHGSVTDNIITIIPISMPDRGSMVRVTGMPVRRQSWISKPREEWTAKDPALPLALISGGKEHEDADISELHKMIEELSNTNQWLNINNKQVDAYLRENGVSINNFSEVTKHGFEFQDIERLRELDETTFEEMERLGYIMLQNLLQDKDLSLNDVKDMWSKFFDENVGPSIVHGEEIRSVDCRLDGVKRLDKSLLLVRYVMSRLFIVGNGVEDSFRSIPDCAHTFNQKRAEKMLIPLCVHKTGILGYSLTSASAGLFSRVHSLKIPKGIISQVICNSLHQTGYGSIGHIQGSNSHVMMDLSAKIMRLNPKFSKSAPNTRGWLISPSGIEYDVRAIIMEACKNLYARFKHTRKISVNEAVVIWHPLFCIIVGINIPYGDIKKCRFESLILSAKRKSSICKSYHNTEPRFSLSFDDRLSIPVNSACLRRGLGFLGSLNKFAKDKDLKD